MSVFSRIANLIWQRKPAPLIPTRSPRDRRRWPDWLSSGLTLDRMASILRDADQGNMQDLMGLLQEIAAREELVNGLLTTRLSALSQRKVKCVENPRDPDQNRAKEVKLFCQDVLDGLKLVRNEGNRPKYERGLSGVVESINLACYYGVQAAWQHWGHQAGSPYPVPIALEFFDERRFYLDIATDTLCLDTEKQSHVPLLSFDPSQYIEVRNSRLTKRLAMAGAGRSILLSWWLRFGTLKDLTNYVETWGRPGLVISASGENPSGYNEDQYEELQQFLEDYIGDTRVLLPPGFDITVLKADTGGEKIFEFVDNVTERRIQFALVGQVGTTAGDASTYASAGAAEKVRADLIQGDARLVSEVLEKVLKDAVSVVFGVEVPSAKVEFENETSIDAIKQRALAIQSASHPLISMLKGGIPIDIKTYCKDMQIPLTETGEIDPQYIYNLKKLLAAGIGGGADTPDQALVPATQQIAQSHIAFEIGDRVRVRPGFAHDERTATIPGTVVSVASPALAIQFDGMSDIHKWYIASELLPA